jgi:hypothetical protein
MGYLSPPPDETTPLEVEIRGSWLPVNRDTVPFIVK